MAGVWKKYAYLILFVYLLAGMFFPVIGVIAIICMLAPVVTAIKKGRFWCGNYCPRGSLWDQVLTGINARTSIPAWARSKVTRIFMLVTIFTVFGWQMYYAWPDPGAIGMVFIRIIFVTTVVGVILAAVYSPRTWCSFCPMGTLASWLSHGKSPLLLNHACVKCGLCSKACPMGLSPYESGSIFAHPDCIKCGKCVSVCRKTALRFEK